ncbi:LacI family DNA-binding transcriptional regulator [Cohnella rhizosphaerae]
MTTIKDIANHAKVSVATVSYVLNNTRYVSPDKKGTHSSGDPRAGLCP